MARPRETSDEEILETARRCFLEHGASVSTGVIAKELGVSTAALFHRFGSKRNLFIKSLLPQPSAFTQGFRLDERSIREQLVDFGRAMLAALQEFQPQLNMLKAAGCSHDELTDHMAVPPPVLVHRALTRFFAEAHQAGRVHTPDPGATAMALMGAVHVRIFMADMVGVTLIGQTHDEYLARVIDALCEGIVPSEGEQG